jgi:cell division protein FtsI/penicillin-binding protein 2
VVVAAAFLSESGNTPPTRVPAPEQLDIGGPRSIENEPQGRCQGTGASNMISMRQALAVSCNTAFIGMAGTLGWPKVRDTALALGFQLRAQPEGAQPLALGRGAETTVGPDTAQGAQIGNDGLGGGGVEGAPLQMAAMIATIANEGRAVQPSLVTAVRRPGFHRTESVTGAQSQRSARPLRTLCVPR